MDPRFSGTDPLGVKDAGDHSPDLARAEPPSVWPALLAGIGAFPLVAFGGTLFFVAIKFQAMHAARVPVAGSPSLPTPLIAAIGVIPLAAVVVSIRRLEKAA